MFSGVDKIEAGMEFHAQTEQGTQIVKVSSVEGDTVTVDGNHPLAGMNLNFDVEITDGRQATQEEKGHGHRHGPGAHAPQTRPGSSRRVALHEHRAPSGAHHWTKEA